MITNVNQFSIDRQDAKQRTRIPFTYDSKLRLPTGSLPVDCIRSLRIQCDETIVPPVRLTSIVTADDYKSAKAYFTDANRAIVGIWDVKLSLTAGTSLDTSYICSLLHSTDGIIVGHISYQTYVGAMLVSSGATMSNKTFNTDDKDFVLHSSTLIPWFRGHARAISINGTAITHDITITLNTYTCAEDSASTVSRPLQLSVVGPYKEPTVLDGIKYLKVTPETCITSVNGNTTYSTLSTDPVWLGGQRLVLRNSIASNLRVIATNVGAQLKGVSDG